MSTFEPVEVTRENIPTAYRRRIETKLKAITKRLAKLNAPAPTVEFGPTTLIPKPLTEEEEMWVDKRNPPMMEVFETVTVHGFEAKHDGWTGVAVLDWTVSPTEAFVARFPGHDADETAPTISEELRTRGPICDHCGTKRSRNNTIAFTHDDGRTIAVGTGCVLEYLGVDPRTILMLSDFVKAAIDEDDYSNVKPCMAPIEFVALAAEITRHFGFVRSGEPGSTKELTTMIGITGTFSNADKELAAELADAIDMERGNAKAAEIAAWLDAETGSSDFIRSAKVAINGNPVEAGSRHAGLLAALPFSHDRHIGLVAERDAKRKAEAEARLTSDFIGEVGDKITVKGVVAFYNTYEARYGTKARVTIVTDTGDRVTTYGSGESIFGWSTGDNVEMTGKVKEHDDHETFGKTTSLERVKMIELDADGNPLPTCDAARCTRPGIDCTDCGRKACPNGHGRGYHDDFLCDSCLEARWDAEQANKDRSKALNVAARVMLGGERAWVHTDRGHEWNDSMIIPERIPA